MHHAQRSVVGQLLCVAIVAVAGCRAAVPSPAASPPATRSSSNAFDIAYHVAWSNPATHLYEVTLNVGRVSGGTIELQLPIWSPGRYAPFFFARNVTDFTVTSRGTTLRWDRTNGSRWRVFTDGATDVSIRYRVYANTLSGTFSVLDTAHANWNGASMFMYVVGHKPDPVRLHVSVPASWQIANGDSRATHQADYSFDNYDRLIDTPTEIAPSLMIDTMGIDERVYRSVVHYNGATSPALRRRFMSDLGKIVRYENTVFDPPPLEMYTFLFHIGYPGGDGMEHLYSTQVISSPRWVENGQPLSGIAIAAHEYFHVWNMKRVRAVALGPFDYEREQYQTTLWVGEGWTQYYGQVALPRSGVQPNDAIYDVAAAIIQANLTNPARKEVSARMASFVAPFFDGATPGYDVNPDAFFSYYTKGAGIALYLDLFIRARTNNQKSLDDAFRLLRDRTWNAPTVSYYLQGRGYTEEDVERAVSDAAGVDMHAWFERHVGGTEDMNYDDVLASAGLRLVRDPQVANDTPPSGWRVVPVTDATPAQAKVREGWLKGTR